MKIKCPHAVVLVICLIASLPLLARHPIPKLGKAKLKATSFIAGCLPAQAQIDLEINNVRARLLTGGDLWWDRQDGAYIVPKPLPGQQGVSAIFAAGVWMGGFDLGGNLKVACQTYGNNSGSSDFWPGPLLESTGTTSEATCSNWDRLFEMKGAEVIEHLKRYQATMQGGAPYMEADIPASVKAWPAQGNPYFQSIYGFSLPDGQPMADFYDQDGDNHYEPLDGDFPAVNVMGCELELPTFPDQLVFAVFNDEGGGNIHKETKGIPIQMETQLTSFAYATADVMNDMTFHRFRHLSRAKEDLDSFFIALWTDVDLGCHLDDYFGCDPSRNFAYYYNVDDEDGQPGITCNGVPTYGTNVPALGIDLIRGPMDENWRELGMSSFMYFGGSDGPTGTGDPNTDLEFYRYLTGSWRDGSRLVWGGDGYDATVTNPAFFTNYAFPNVPNDANGWSMCHPGPDYPQGLPPYDRRTLQATGPIRLQPGSINELLYGVVFAPNITYPCPDLSRLFAADDYAQAFFDNCMEVWQDGPDAPDVDWIAGDRTITGILTNSSNSNNEYEDFESEVFGHPRWVTDSTYNFEGYLIYQVVGPQFSLADIHDTTKARLAFECDFENEFSTVKNWKAVPNPDYQLTPGAEQFIYNPTEVIEGKNSGIRHEFTLTEDLFAKGNDRRLQNHREYYYVALAYAVNNFEPFNPDNGLGQKAMYIIGRRNIGPKAARGTYIVLPRPVQNGLENVQIVPNPYYNAAAYADGNGNGVLKITNLPAKCEVDIYSLDGKFVRHFSRNEVPAPPNGSGVTEQQIYPDLIWDLKNEPGKTIASGIYLVRIQADGIGEVTLKAVVI